MGPAYFREAAEVISAAPEDRQTALTTDFRSVLGEVLANHVGVKVLASVFPGFANDARKFPGLLKT